MSQFESSTDRRKREERRQARLAEARRRVASGEATPPPPAGGSEESGSAGSAVGASAGSGARGTLGSNRAGSKRAGTSGSKRGSAGGSSSGSSSSDLPPGRYALWRSTQHFCTPDSRPDAEARTIGPLVDFSPTIVPFQLRRRLVALLTSDGTWMPVRYLKDGALAAISQAQAEKYHDVRLGRASDGTQKHRNLTPDDHPEETQQL